MRISKLQLKQIWEGWTNLLFRFKNIKITTKYCKIISDELDIFNYENLNIKDKKILIIAPHADDAEISVYSEEESKVFKKIKGIPEQYIIELLTRE